MPVDRSRWRAWKPTKKALRLVLDGLRDGREMASDEIAEKVNMPWIRVCRTLDYLMVRGEVSREEGRFRRA